MRKKKGASANTRSRWPRSHRVPTAARWRARRPQREANGIAMSHVSKAQTTLLRRSGGHSSAPSCAIPPRPGRQAEVRRPGLADRAVTERTGLDLPVSRWRDSPLSRTHPRCHHWACKALAEPLGVAAGPGPGAPLSP